VEVITEERAEPAGVPPPEEAESVAPKAVKPAAEKAPKASKGSAKAPKAEKPAAEKTPKEAPPVSTEGTGGEPPSAEPPEAAAEPLGPDVIPPDQPPPGITLHSQRLLQQLPGIYHTDFMSRFLALFEATLLPLEWTVDNFDLFLSPGTSPTLFLPWLANWYEIIFDSTWSEAQRRTLLKEAHKIYSRRGTRWALNRVLEIYLGKAPEIEEFQDERDPYTFTIKLPVRSGQYSQELIERLVDVSKPAHTNYILKFKN
jgi:phage tail-like protein